MRQTIITLYYKNKENGEIMPEARKVDVGVLIKSPYEYLINLLLENPKNEKLIKVIPNGTKINNIELRGDIVYIDFSKEFTENVVGGEEEENKIIKSIVNTLTELTEVNSVRILIEGEENKCFKDEAVNFKENFFRFE